MRTKHKDDFEPYWQDEKDWLCIVEFLPADNPEARLLAADIIGYLVGYANLTDTRSLALLGDPDASAYELLFGKVQPQLQPHLGAAYSHRRTMLNGHSQCRANLHLGDQSAVDRTTISDLHKSLPLIFG